MTTSSPKELKELYRELRPEVFDNIDVWSIPDKERRYYEAEQLRRYDSDWKKAANKRKSEKVKPKTKLSSILLFLVPIWLPIAYLSLLYVEKKSIGVGPLSMLATPMLWVTPAIGAISILFSSTTHLLLKLIFIPTYYYLGIVLTGIIGWSYGCSIGVVGCN